MVTSLCEVPGIRYTFTAVMALDMTDKPLMLFRNPDNKTLNIVYRRPDGNIGWIDTAGIQG